MEHQTKINFKSTLRHNSPYCPRCNTSFDVNLICGEIDAELSESVESHQVRASMFRAIPTMITEDPDGLFLDAVCQKCKKPMVMVDTGVIQFVKRLTAMKLFTSFSCEGHMFPKRIHRATGLPYEGCSTPYIAFIDNGKTIHDILVYYVLSKNIRYQLVGRSGHEYQIFDKKHPELQALTWDTEACAIYSASKCFTPEEFEAGKVAFIRGLYTLMDLLPVMIRDWYDNCQDNFKEFTDTERKKARYRAAWERNLNAVEAIERYNGNDTEPCCK